MILFLVLFLLFFSQKPQFQVNLTNEVTNSSVYASYRFYDSKVGRFLSADPVVPEAQSNKGLSRYAYVYNNPIEFDDPDGHVPNNRSREVRDYDEALIDYNNQVLADLGYAGFAQENEEDQKVDGARIGQAGAFGAREALRLHFAPTTKAGQTAKIMLSAPGVFIDPLDTTLLGSIAAPKVGGHKAILNLSHSRLDERVLNVLFDDLVTVSTELWLRFVTEARHEGIRLGLGQVPVLGSDTELSQAVELGNSSGFKVPAFLSVLGGGLGILSAAQYENDFAKVLGITGGGLELGAGLVMAKESSVLRSLSTHGVRHISAFRLLKARSASVLGGWMSLAAWGVFELNEFVPQKPLTPDWESMSPEERIETENKFIDPGF